jgi:cell division protein FtsI/penicillin-binding protein 2
MEHMGYHSQNRSPFDSVTPLHMASFMFSAVSGAALPQPQFFNDEWPMSKMLKISNIWESL